ncbi:MAG: hypothetical protein ABIN91_02215 [Mucilaginibacter sp.]|uniref:hypothetical protein n=1 Tax=Mucilaginibacter sp. TaxID=1882438 RepID=UPI00326708AE
MEKNNGLKILLLSDAPMSLNEGGISQTLYNLFSFVEPENILAIAPKEELRTRQPTAPYNTRYKSYISSWLNLPPNRITKYLFSFVRWLNFSICQISSYRELKNDIAGFNPDVIISCPNSPIGVLMHHKLLGDIKQIPIIPYFMDDWMYQSKTKWLGGNVQKLVCEILSQNKRWIMISNELAEIFRERYRVFPEKVLAARNPVDMSNAPIDKEYKKGDPFTIAYAGALWPMHYDSFYSVAKAVQCLAVDNSIELLWYGPQSQWDWRKKELTLLGVVYGGHLPYTQVHATLNKADALLITSSFKPEYYTHSKGSLQTKITDYCKAKRLIISCGPSYSANHNFIKQMDCGICIETNDSKVIAEQLTLIIHNIEKHQYHVANGWESLKNFSTEIVHLNLKSFLISTIEEKV